MPGFPQHGFDENEETTSQEHAPTEEWLHSQAKGERRNGSDQDQGSNGQPRIGDKHADEFAKDFEEDAHGRAS